MMNIFGEVEGKVFNISRCTPPTGSIYIGRGSTYGNPFRIGIHGTRAQVIERYRREILPTLDIEPLRGKNLTCFCAPLPCHGDVILEALKSPR